MSTTYDTLNNVLVRLFHDIMTLEEKAIRTGEFSEISNNDMHIIEAIGLGAGDTMSAIAKKLNVTAGTLTTSMNRLVRQDYVVRQRSTEDRRVVMITLTEKGERAYRHHVKKGYVNRTRSEKDRRVVLISLTEKGRRAYEHHRLFHDKMIKATIANMSEQEEEVLAQALTNLIGFFEQYQQ